MLEIKDTKTEIKDTLNGLITRLDIAQKRIFELEDITVETDKTEKQREIRMKKNRNKISVNCGTTIKDVTRA